MPMLIRGSELYEPLKKEVLQRFCMRFTKDHIPAWGLIRGPKGFYKPQFASDVEWLENTFFWITKSGRIADRPKFCESRPTWPDGRGFGTRVFRGKSNF
jgi:hypothetical protein